jgi:hypothetical protein
MAVHETGGSISAAAQILELEPEAVRAAVAFYGAHPGAIKT